MTAKASAVERRERLLQSSPATRRPEDLAAMLEPPSLRDSTEPPPPMGPPVERLADGTIERVEEIEGR